MIKRMIPMAMREYRRYEQNNDQNWQQPSRSQNQFFRQCHVDSADREQREDDLPSRFRFVDWLSLSFHCSANITSPPAKEAIRFTLPSLDFRTGLTCYPVYRAF